MGDHIYYIRGTWRGDSTIVEASNSNYIPEGRNYSDGARDKALVSLAETLRPIFGQDTERILSDPKATGDFDRDGFIDLDLKYIFEKYTSPAYKPGASASLQELKTKLLSHPFKQTRFTEYFRDSLPGGKRPKADAQFPFPRHDVKAAAGYFNARFGGDTLKDAKEPDKLMAMLESYLGWAAVHSIEAMSDDARINTNDGLSQFSKNAAGQSRIDCGGFSDLAEKVLGGIKGPDGNPVFSFSHARVAYRDLDYSHAILIAKSKGSRESIYVSNEAVWLDSPPPDRGVYDYRIWTDDPRHDSQAVIIEDKNGETVAARWRMGASIRRGLPQFIERLRSGIPAEILSNKTIEWARALERYIQHSNWQSDMPRGKNPAKITRNYIEVLVKAASLTISKDNREKFLAAARKVAESPHGDSFAKSLLAHEREGYNIYAGDPKETHDNDFKTVVSNFTPENKTAIADLAAASSRLPAGRLAEYFLGNGDDIAVGMVDSPVFRPIVSDLIDKMNPGDGRHKFFALIGRGMEARRRNDMAAKYFKRALDMWPRGEKGYSSVAASAVRNTVSAGDEKSARAIAKKAEAGGHDFTTWDERLDLAGMLNTVGRYGEAAEILKNAPRELRSNPEYAATRFEVVANLARQKNKPLADENVSNFVEDSISRGKTHFLKQSRNGLRERRPGDRLRFAAHLFRLGETMVKQGYGKFASDLFQAAEELDPAISAQIDRLFDIEDGAPEWKDSGFICAENGEFRPCKTGDIVKNTASK